MKANLDIATIEKKLGYEFKDKQLLEKSFVHSSYANAHNLASYDNLEFLGDSILEFVVSDCLYQKHDGSVDEGVLTNYRKNIVEKKSLNAIAKKLGINQYVLYENIQNIDYEDMKMFGDVVEALIASIYLDGGYEKARQFILRIFGEALESVSKPKKNNNFDYKTALQEYCQKQGNCQIKYELIERSGMDNNPTFKMMVSLNGKKLGEGIGSSKKIAEQHSAEMALATLKKGKK